MSSTVLAAPADPAAHTDVADPADPAAHTDVAAHADVTAHADPKAVVATAPAATSARRPGRPRDEDLDRQIIDATLAMIDTEEEITVSRIIARSGVSRAALYRRWPSLTTLIAAALDVGRTVPPEIPTDGDLRAAIFAGILGDPASLAPSVTAAGYSEARFRQRIRLVMGDRELQRAYWNSHVARRRVPIEDAFRAGIGTGLLRSDLNVAACFDALAGAAYYQIVVRGERLTDASTRDRLRTAFDVVWRGMLADPAPETARSSAPAAEIRAAET